MIKPRIQQFFVQPFLGVLPHWRPLRWAGGVLSLGSLSLGTLLLGAVYSTALPAEEAGFTITRAEAKLVNQVYHLAAEINYVFSNKVLEAIQSGVPVVIALEIEVRRPRGIWWDEEVAHLKQRFQLQYHALAEQYIVKNLNSGAQNTAPTLNTALFYLNRIENLPLIDQQLLKPGEKYEVRVKVGLEFDSLPVPLKLSAYTNTSWWLGSGWFEWEL